jgi:hypothetical protein
MTTINPRRKAALKDLRRELIAYINLRDRPMMSTVEEHEARCAIARTDLIDEFTEVLILDFYNLFKEEKSNNDEV